MTFHLTVPDGDLLYKLGLPYAFAVPAGTPPEDVGFDPVAGDGPVRDQRGDGRAHPARAQSALP